MIYVAAVFLLAHAEHNKNIFFVVGVYESTAYFRLPVASWT
jgi:hypothetical protein